ncbi:MAG: AAA family ATPase [Chloroflexota bacterium]
MRKTIPYAVSNYVELVDDNGYFVDKTHYVAKLERIKNPVFLRPRRFGKSLWCRILEMYYSVNHVDDFERLFGDTYIGQNPTGRQNSYIVLHFDFSKIDPGHSLDDLESSFSHSCNLRMRTVVGQAQIWFQDRIEIDLKTKAWQNLDLILSTIAQYGLPPLYVIIDEYDNFANHLITTHQDRFYGQLTADDSFLRTFFKVLKEGRKTGVIANVFITGVLPMTIEELASSFNIATYLTLDPEFESMLGFTQPEVDHLLDDIYQDYAIDPSTRNEVNELIKNQYDGYHFVSFDGETLYNSTILLYFLRDFTRFKQIPEFLTDLNLRTDLSWIKRLTGRNPANTENLLTQLTNDNSILYNRTHLTSKFTTSQFFEPDFYPISFFYLGMLTRQDQFVMKLPNLNMRQIFVEYFNEFHNIDSSACYADMMRSFIANPDIERLFSDYWTHYVSQLPEVIFQQVNENFYRTTFYALCSHYLSGWFSFNVERSYPKGKSDLEFVGKYHEKFAGLRWVIEFKYYSNSDFKRLFSTSLAAFEVQEADTVQIGGYVDGLRKEYPEAQIAQFVIYCVGNQGFRVFKI